MVQWADWHFEIPGLCDGRYVVDEPNNFCYRFCKERCFIEKKEKGGRMRAVHFSVWKLWRYACMAGAMCLQADLTCCPPVSSVMFGPRHASEHSLTVTVAKGQPVHQQRVRLIPGWWPCHTSHKTLAKGRRWAACCLQRHRGEPTATGCVGCFNSLAVGWLFLMEEQLLPNKIFTGWAVTRGNCLSPEGDKQGPLLHTFSHLSVWCCWGSGGSGLAPCVILSSPKPSLPVGLQLWARIWCLLHLVPGRGGLQH